jgi:serine/threonine protein kinase
VEHAAGHSPGAHPPGAVLLRAGRRQPRRLIDTRPTGAFPLGRSSSRRRPAGHKIGETTMKPILLAGNPQAPRDAAHLVETLARAVHAAHQEHVIHRDLKPANVLLTADGPPKVTDFGLARMLDEAGQTSTGVVLGTPSHLAPEQASGKSREVGPATDVYALVALGSLGRGWRDGWRTSTSSCGPWQGCRVSFSPRPPWSWPWSAAGDRRSRRVPGWRCGALSFPLCWRSRT